MERHRLWRCGRETHGQGVRRQGRGRRTRGQRAEGGGDGRNRLVDGNVADDCDLDGALGQRLLQNADHVGGADEVEVEQRRRRPSGVAVVKQKTQIALHHSVRRSGESVQLRRGAGAYAIESLASPTRRGDIGSQNLELGVEIGRPGYARQDEGVVARPESQAVDLGREHPLHVVVGNRLEAAEQIAARVGRPSRGGPVGRQPGQAVADLHRDQDLVVGEPGRLDAEAHAVGETNRGDAEVGDRLAVDDLSGRAEIGVGPVQFGLDRKRLDRR